MALQARDDRLLAHDKLQHERAKAAELVVFAGLFLRINSRLRWANGRFDLGQLCHRTAGCNYKISCNSGHFRLCSQ
jgi:hypothetical protein